TLRTSTGSRPPASSAASPAGGTPVTVVSESLNAATGDDAYLYFTTATGMVERLPKAGGPSQVLSSDQQVPWAIVVADTELYWLDRGTYRGGSVGYRDGRLMRQAKDGSTAAAPLKSVDGAWALSQTPTYVFYN